MSPVILQSPMEKYTPPGARNGIDGVIESLATTTDGPKTGLAKDFDSFPQFMDIMAHFYRADAERFAFEDHSFDGNNLPIPLQPTLKVFYSGFLDAMSHDLCLSTQEKLFFMYPQIYFKQRAASHESLFAACAGAFVMAEAATSVWQPQQVRDIFGVTKELYNQGVCKFFTFFNRARSRKEIIDLFPQAFIILQKAAYQPSGRGIITVRHSQSPFYEDITITSGQKIRWDRISYDQSMREQ